MMRRKQGIACILIGILILQSMGCDFTGNHQKENKDIISNQQESENRIEDLNPVYGRSDSIVLDIGMDFKEMGFEYFDDAVELYQDKDLANKIYCQYDWDKEKHTLSLLPPQYTILNVATNFASKSLLQEFDHSDYSFFDKGENRDWGNLGTMYLVKWIDLKTGQKLEEPKITDIYIKGELETPKNFQFGISEYGNGTLSWDPVEGAEWYLIVEAIYKTDGISGFYSSCDIVAETKDTMWQSETKEDYMNSEFGMQTVVLENQSCYFGVIAIGKEGTSMISSVLSKDEMAKQLPFCMEDNENEGEDRSIRYANSVDLLSRYQWIQLCDKTMAQRLLKYRIHEAEIVNVTGWEEEEQKMLRVPYTVEGTDFEGSFYVEGFDYNTYKEDLEVLHERQNILKNKISGMLKDVQITVKPEMGESMKSEKKEVCDPTATTELSGYLASCMLQGEEYILLSKKQESLDQDTLMDAFYEAYFQNPLIPAVKELSISQSGKELSITYEEEEAEREKKQQEVKEQVDFVVEELLEPGMSDVDKVLAINSYLCDSVVYDERVAEESLAGKGTFTDSMTSYGALIYHKGVCTAYAGAFQLLAKAMGLESIVVTGTLNGNRNHAWNKVKIEGKWCVVDVTSNAGSEVKNVALNLPDKVAELMLKEDDRYLCDGSIGQYSADTEEFEYYHLSGQYYEKNKIAEALVKELSYGKKAVMRTDETLTDKEFQTIVSEVMDSMDQIKMEGYYQLGVVYLERK